MTLDESMVQVNTCPRLFYPCAEYAARGHGYAPAPQLGMDTAGNAALSVEGYAVLHGGPDRADSEPSAWRAASSP